MSDLQCPATFVLLAAETAHALDARMLRLAAVFADTTVGAAAQAEVARVAAAHGCMVQRAHMGDRAALAEQIEQLADGYRGETVLLLAPSAAICAALRRTGPLVQPAILAVDSDGWSVRAG